MDECNSHNVYPNLSVTPSNEQQFRRNKINEVKDYFIAEIKERELMSKRLSKYIASFDYFDQSLIVLSIATGSISIASFATVIRAPVGMMSIVPRIATSDMVMKLLEDIYSCRSLFVYLLFFLHY